MRIPHVKAFRARILFNNGHHHYMYNLWWSYIHFFNRFPSSKQALVLNFRSHNAGEGCSGPVDQSKFDKAVAFLKNVHFVEKLNAWKQRSLNLQVFLHADSIPSRSVHPLHSHLLQSRSERQQRVASIRYHQDFCQNGNWDEDRSKHTFSGPAHCSECKQMLLWGCFWWTDIVELRIFRVRVVLAPWLTRCIWWCRLVWQSQSLIWIKHLGKTFRFVFKNT